MWNWVQDECYTFLRVLERCPKVWIVPCFFFLFCLGLLAWLNSNLNQYFETRSVTNMTPFLDQFITNFYAKIREKIVHRYLMLGTVLLFVYGYLRCRKKLS